MQIDISPSEQQKLAHLAAARGFPSVEAYASEILVTAAHAVEKCPPKKAVAENGKQLTAYDVAQQMGIIGMSSDGPSDLATNPAHMEGFG